MAPTDDGMGIETSGGMLVEQAMQRLNRDILAGVLPPGGRLRVQALARDYGFGATPIREALWRLSSDGLVRATDNRGFRVREISREDLLDIVQTRQLIETEALRRSMRRGGNAWEAGIVSTLHVLKKSIARGSAALRDGHAAFDAVHKDFHTRLIAACGSERMIALHRTLFDQTYRYRLLSPQSYTRVEHLDREHEILAELTLARDETAATERLARHLASTLALFDEAGAAPGAAKPRA